MAQRTVLITGFPGFLAGRLVPRLVARGDRVVALVEPRMAERARSLAPAGVEVQPGDITDPRLGLDDATYDRLAGEVTEVHHLAAVYDLAVGQELAERVNVLGTQHVVDFTRRAPRLERHHYVSTAYVAGLRSGLVCEDELAAGQEFKNFYESTKFAAEVVVRVAMDDVPTTIYRPAIVVGDSRTGETQKFDGPYYMLRTIIASKGPLPQIGSDHALFNVVPVDFVVDAIDACIGNPEAEGRTLHLVDPEPISSAEVFRLLAKAWDGRTPSIKVPLGVLDRSLKYRAVREFYGGTPRESLRYLNHPVRFDVTNAAAVLGGAGLRCPRFPEYVDAMVGFFREHCTDPAYRPVRSG
ncbi:MAG: SDR family oxidoreductase [Solirubrobacterales bacterium]|nr:SDR family oxidoreductase [Solirubrobacterales bacterium]